MRSRTTIVNITYDVQGVNRQPLDKIAHSDNEIVRTLGGNNGANDYIDVGMFIRLYTRLMQQLLNDVRKFLRQRFPHLRARVFGRNILANLYQLIQRNQIPVVQISFPFLYQLQFLFGIIYQSAYFFLFTFA